VATWRNHTQLFGHSKVTKTATNNCKTVKKTARKLCKNKMVSTHTLKGCRIKTLKGEEEEEIIMKAQS